MKLSAEKVRRSTVLLNSIEEIDEWIEDLSSENGAVKAAVGYLLPLATADAGDDVPVIDIRHAPAVTIDQEPVPMVPAPPRERRQRKEAAPAATPAPQTGGKPITGPQQRVLDALAWWGSVGYRPGTGNFNNLVSTLSAAGLAAYPVAGSIGLTEAGAAAAHRPSTPGSTAELHARIYDRLTGPQRRVLGTVIAAYPAPIDRDTLAQRSGYSVGTGNFNNLVSALRSLELIEYPAKGRVIAASILFIDHKPRAVAQ